MAKSTSSLAVHASDLHLGVRDTPDVDVAIGNLVQVLEQASGEAEHVRLIIDGDLIAGPLQRHHVGDWQEVVRRKLRPLALFLAKSGIETTYLPGNCEKSEDMREEVIRDRFSSADVRFKQAGNGKPDAAARAFHPQRFVDVDDRQRSVTLHGHELEPSRTTLMGEAAIHTVTRMMVGVRGVFKNLASDVLGADFLDRATAAKHLRLALHDDPRLAAIVDEVDMGSHQSNVDLNLRLNQKLPGFALHLKDHLVRDVLEEVYLRTYVACVGQLVARKELHPPRILSFGHIHHAAIYPKSVLRRDFGVMNGHIPDFVVNSGTGTPLTREHGGDDFSQVVVLRDGIPELWLTSDPAGPRMINRAGRPQA